MSEEDDKNALDDALEQLLDKVDEYQSLRSNVNDLLKNAFFELARAKLDSSSSALKLSERSYDLSPHAATTTVLHDGDIVKHDYKAAAGTTDEEKEAELEKKDPLAQFGGSHPSSSSQQQTGGGWRAQHQQQQQAQQYTPAGQMRPRYPPMRPPSPSYGSNNTSSNPKQHQPPPFQQGRFDDYDQPRRWPTAPNAHPRYPDLSDHSNRTANDDRWKPQNQYHHQYGNNAGSRRFPSSFDQRPPTQPLNQRFEIPYRDKSPRKRPREDWDSHQTTGNRFAAAPLGPVIGDSYTPSSYPSRQPSPPSAATMRVVYPSDDANRIRRRSPSPAASSSAWKSRRTPSPSPDRFDRPQPPPPDRRQQWQKPAPAAPYHPQHPPPPPHQSRVAPSYYPPIPPPAPSAAQQAPSRPWGRDLYRPAAPATTASESAPSMSPQHDRRSPPLALVRPPSPRTHDEPHSAPAATPSLLDRIEPVARPLSPMRARSETPTSSDRPFERRDSSIEAEDSEMEDGELVDGDATPPRSTDTPPPLLDRIDTTGMAKPFDSAKPTDEQVVTPQSDERRPDEAPPLVASTGPAAESVAAEVAAPENVLPESATASELGQIAAAALDVQHQASEAVPPSDSTQVDTAEAPTIDQPMVDANVPPSSPKADMIESAVPSPPVTPPRDMQQILMSVISANEQDDGTTKAILEENRSTSERKHVDSPARPRRAEVTFAWDENDLRSSAVIHPFLFQSFEARDERIVKRTLELRSEYKALDADWRAHCKRLNRLKGRLQRRRQRTVPQTPADQIQTTSAATGSYFPEMAAAASAPAQPATGRANRRGTASGFAYGDAVRSEAEFLEILASLEHADMRDPTVRANRTAAVVPDMVIDPFDRRNLLSFDEGCRVVEDPESFFGVHEPLDFWTEEEVETFCKRYASHPKQFGRIAAELPGKTTQQCVLFYYRMKTTIDFRSLSNQRRDGRRRKPRKRLGPDGKPATGPSLLSNLKRTRPDEDDDAAANGDPNPLSPYQQVRSNPSSRLGSSRGTVAFLASEGTLEAAEALGSLRGDTADETDEYDPSVSAASAAKGGKKRRGAAAASGEAGDGSSTKTTRRKTTTAASWSAAERDKMLQLLRVHGKDWTKLSQGIKTKTPIQCRNWFQNHSKRLKLAEIAANAEDDMDEDGGSAPQTPAADFTVPTGMSINKALSTGAATANAPKPGFFLDTSRGGRRSPRVGGTADLPSFDEKSLARAGMQIRSLLNEDSADGAGSTDGRDDWFANDPASNATTEDESEAPPPPPAQHRQQQPQPQPQRQQHQQHPLGRHDDDRLYRDSPAGSSRGPIPQFGSPALGRPMDWTFRRATQFPMDPPARDGLTYGSFGSYPSPGMRPYSPNATTPSSSAGGGVRSVSDEYAGPVTGDYFGQQRRASPYGYSASPSAMPHQQQGGYGRQQFGPSVRPSYQSPFGLERTTHFGSGPPPPARPPSGSAPGLSGSSDNRERTSM